MAGQAAAHLDLQPADRQVELVVDDDQAARSSMPKRRTRRRHGQAGVVHVGLGEGQGQPPAADP